MRSRIVAVILLVLSLLLIGSPAFAAGNGLRNGYSLALNSWPTLLAAAVGVLSTEATAFLTHRSAPQWVKSVVHLALSTLGGVIVTVTIVPGSRWTDYVGTIFTAWVAGLLAHVAGATAAIEHATAQFGVGAVNGVKPSQ